ncbi:hypothetical protein [Paracoccus methylarcula]|uniref:Uncharacterized protein n=1 Tax=Paracoccus methylarcula TaxID=72022 RepID=A0A422QSB5_9RHOB|nr:hypothetical protein [Paracoccus methylarcula]RNF32855.1 hypothetical protein A7A09_019860 [Paracoccus methylarcula]
MSAQENLNPEQKDISRSDLTEQIKPTDLTEPVKELKQEEKTLGKRKRSSTWQWVCQKLRM